MRMLLFLLPFISTDYSVGATLNSPFSDCRNELKGYKELVTAKASIKASLVAAFSAKQMQIISTLEQAHGIDVQTEEGDSLLMLAAKNGLTDVVNDLLDMKNVTITISNDAITAASQQAQKAGFKEVAEILKDTALEFGGQTALHKAAQAGDLDGVARMIKSVEFDGADVNRPGLYGYTPLHWAAACANKTNYGICGSDTYEGHTEILKLLLTLPSTDLNAIYNESTLLHWAAENDNIAFVKLLLNAPGIQVNAKSGYIQFTPLMRAVQKGNTEIVELLLKTPGVVAEEKDNYGQTPLHWAARYGYINIVELLLKTPGIEVFTADNEGLTPLHGAARRGHTGIVQILLDTPKIAINARDNYSVTPLHLAAKEHNTEVLKLLLNSAGIQVNAEDLQGRTPLRWATESDWGREVIVEILKAAGGV